MKRATSAGDRTESETSRHPSRSKHAGDPTRAIGKARKRKRGVQEGNGEGLPRSSAASSSKAASASTRDNRPRSPFGSQGPFGPYGRCPNVSARYEKLGRIGEGTYGVVYQARDKETSEIVALKRCLPHHEASDGFPLTTLREITLLRELAVHKHPGIVRLKDVAVSSSRSGVFLVFEYCEHDMASLVDGYYAGHRRSPFRESEVKQLSMQLLSALSFLHSRHILHRDLKLSNLLYNHRGELRMADFGLARKVSRTRVTGHDLSGAHLTPKVVSLWYRPPELLLGSDVYDEGVDSWGAGCIVGELLLGVPLIKGTSEMDQIAKMFQLLGPPSPEEWPGLNDLPLVKNRAVEIPSRFSWTKRGGSLRDRFDKISDSGISLLQGLLSYDMKKRWTADDALTSRYFTHELPRPTDRRLMPTFPTKHITKR